MESDEVRERKHANEKRKLPCEATAPNRNKKTKANFMMMLLS